MKYTLETSKAFGKKSTLGAAVKRFLPLMKPETGLVIVALAAMLVSTGTALVGPVLIGRGIDTYIRLKDTRGLLMAARWRSRSLWESTRSCILIASGTRLSIAALPSRDPIRLTWSFSKLT